MRVCDESSHQVVLISESQSYLVNHHLRTRKTYPTPSGHVEKPGQCRASAVPALMAKAGLLPARPPLSAVGCAPR